MCIRDRAKDDATHIGLSRQMAVHSVERAYQTVVYGGFAQDEMCIRDRHRDTRLPSA